VERQQGCVEYSSGESGRLRRQMCQALNGFRSNNRETEISSEAGREAQTVVTGNQIAQRLEKLRAGGVVVSAQEALSVRLPIQDDRDGRGADFSRHGIHHK
jgi:hypothetical protein